MTQNDLAKKLNQHFGLRNKPQSEAMIDFIFSTIKDEMYRGKKIRIWGFATFYLDVTRSVYRNPYAGTMHKRPRWRIKISFHKSFKEKVKDKPCYYEEENTDD